MRKSLRTLGLMSAALIVSSAAFAQDASDGMKKDAKPDKPQRAEIGEAAPGFELTGVDGEKRKLADYQDKIVVLEWFNQDCPYCVRNVPSMKELIAKYKDNANVVWLGVDSTHYMTVERNKDFIQKNGIEYPILMDTDGEVGRTYGARTTPHMFVINKGKLVYSGAIDDRGDRKYVSETLDALLAGKEVPLAKTKPYGCSVKYKKGKK